MFDFRDATAAQCAAAATTDGPVLVTGAPGTGKTRTLAIRAAYLVQENGVAPESIQLLTISEEDAARLRKMIQQEFSVRGMAHLSDKVQVDTFVSLCRRLLRRSSEYRGPDPYAKMLSPEAKQFLLYEKYLLLRRSVPGLGMIENSAGEETSEGTEPRYIYAQRTGDLISSVMESLVQENALLSSNEPEERMIGALMQAYRQLLIRMDATDESTIKTVFLKLLRSSRSFRQQVSDDISYLMIDGYEDTTLLDAEIARLIVSNHGNICAAGDDDEAIFREKGSWIQNIFRFRDMIPGMPCHNITLTINFRSNDDIVEMNSAWISTIPDAGSEWGKYHRAKAVRGTGRSQRSPAVVRIAADSEEAWQRASLSFFRDMTHKDTGKMRCGYAVYLADDIRHPRHLRLADALQQNGFAVYAPGTDFLFGQSEVRMLLGAMLLHAASHGLKVPDTLQSFADAAGEVDGLEEYMGLFSKNLTMLEVLAAALTFPAFSNLLQSNNASDIRIYNISALAEMVRSFCEIPKSVLGEDPRETFFTKYLPMVLKNGISNVPSALPTNAVTMLPIMSVPGREFPFAVVDVSTPDAQSAAGVIADTVERRLLPLPPLDPPALISLFDRRRRYYMAFSRARSLLAVTGIDSPANAGILNDPCIANLADPGAQQFSVREISCEPAQNSDSPDLSWLMSYAPGIPKTKKDASDGQRTRRFMRSLSVSAARKYHVDDDTAHNDGGKDQSDD